MAGMLLASLDEFKAYKGIKKEENDPKLMLMLEYASNMFKEMTKRSFIDYWDTPKVELHDGTKYDTILLKEFPVRKIEKVEYSFNGSFLPGTVYTLVEYQDYLLNTDESTLFSPYYHICHNRPFAYRAIPGTQNIKITYTAGYEITPPDITMAILDLVDYQREEQFTPRKAFEGMSVENLGFRDNSTALPAHIKRVMELYRVGN